MNFKSFNDLRNYLDEVPEINCGGCGYSAFFIYEFFKQEGKSPEIVFFYGYGNPNYDRNNDALKGKGKPSACGHVMVKIGEKVYDSEGEHNFEDAENDWDNLYHIVPEDFLLKALANKNRWNSMFDRDQEVPEMEKKIGINLPVK